MQVQVQTKSTMTINGRGGRGSGRGGRGSGRGCGDQHQSRAPAGRNTSKKHVGLEAAMTDNVLTYNEKGAADTMQKTLKKLVKYIGTLYGQDITNDIGNHTVVTIAKPKHSIAVLLAHAAKETLRIENYNRLLLPRQAQESLLQQSAANDPEITMNVAELQNDMALQAATHDLTM